MGYGDILLSMFNDEFTIVNMITTVWNWYDVAIYGFLAPIILWFCAFIAYQKSYNALTAYPILVISLWLVTQAVFQPLATIAFFIIVLLLTFGFYKMLKGD